MLRNSFLEKWRCPTKVYLIIRTTWQDQLTNRQVIFLGLAAFSTVAGCVEGTLQLQLSEQGVYLRGFSHVYFPLLVGTIETLLLGGGIFIVNRLWLNTVAHWELWATQMLVREEQQSSNLSSQNVVVSATDSISSNNGQSMPKREVVELNSNSQSSTETQTTKSNHQQEPKSHHFEEPVDSKSAPEVPLDKTSSPFDFGDSDPIGIDREELEGADES